MDQAPAHGTGTPAAPAPLIELPVVPAPGTGTRRASLVPEGGMRNIGDSVREWTRSGIAAVAAGDRFEWDTGLVLIPGPQGGLMTAYTIVLFLPSPLLGAPPLGTVRPLPDNPPKELVQTAALSAVEELRERRSRLLKPA